ncbi:hypothetical protein Y032_0043g844 [Ancylostoma ceylanicum]|uniref:SCP domain-containing protein n=1 Tax=Ancylostoma ceylanicum TaxID=53326 RepID=A0A016UFG9_9BILA|nr:hypothetical protein Y032_0043g844 [Ancylostoma ceylanicum]
MTRFLIIFPLAFFGVVKEAEATANTTAAATTTAAVTTTEIPRCPDSGMNHAARRAFLNTHNRLRSRLAKGEEFNGNFGMAPQAANMQKMQYDCFAESTAMAHARTCSGKLSNPDTRPGLKENFIEIYKTYMTLPQTARHASQRWWKELSMYGVNPNMLFTAQMRRATTKIIRHFGKMAWHDNVRLGCGIARCPKFSFVVCHYGPGGNIIGENFYTVGSPCSMCPGGTTCNNSTMLCDSP